MAEANGTGDERLIVSLEARIKQFEREIGKAEARGTKAFTNLRRSSKGATAQMEADIGRASSRINAALSSVSSQIGTFGKSFLGGLAVGAITAGLGEITTNLRQTIRGIAEVGDSAKRSGLGLQAFQEWSFVADQNRVSVDALVDGFKELNLRADEWITTGGGSAAEAFARLGFTASDLRDRLKDPSALMLEIIGRLQRLDRAAQIRISDELFGGTGGEQFVQLLEQGEDGLRRTIDRAHELGAVLDQEAVARASELDRKFGEITARADALFKRMVIGASELGDAEPEWMAWLRNHATGNVGGYLLGELIDPDSATSRIVEELAGLSDAGGATIISAASLQSAQDLERMVPSMIEGAISLRDELRGVVDALDAAGQTEAASALEGVADRLDAIIDRAGTGQIAAAELQSELSTVGSEASSALEQVASIDGVSLSGVVGAVSTLIGVLRLAAGAAAAVKANMPGVDTTALGGFQPDLGRFGNPYADQEQPTVAPETSPRPKARPFELGVPDIRPAGGGGGGGGGATQRDDFEEAIAQIERETAMLQAEAAAYLDAAEAGSDYGDMVDYARKKAELLTSAQQAGVQITPELTAMIEEQARAYATAGMEAEQAAERIRQIEEQSNRGKDALGSVFDAIVEGGGRAKEAVAQLLMEIAKAKFSEAMFGLLDALNPSGSILGGLGKLLSGGRAKGGGVKAGHAYQVNEDTPRSEVFVPSQNGAILNVQQAQAALRGASQARAQAAPPQQINMNITMDESTGSLRAMARNEAGKVLAEGAPNIVRNAVRATDKAMASTKQFGRLR